MKPIRHILCPTDFSPTAQQACDYAAGMARAFGAEIILVHVIPEMNYPTRSFGMAVAFPNLREELHQRAQAELDRQRQNLGSDLKSITEVRQGVSHEQILECAKAFHADMIVMGTHGHTGLTHFVLGSTAERVLRMSTCPVLTVRKSD